MRTWAALLLTAAGCWAQLSSSISLSNGVRIQVSAHLGEPTGQQTLSVEMLRASGDSFYRIFWDQNHLAVYAYELQVGLTAGGDALRAIAKPAEDQFAARFPNADAGKPVPTLSAGQELGPLTSGQSATLDLFQIPGMGVHLTETIRVEFGDEGGSGALRFSELRVRINGAEAAGPSAGAVAGRYAVFYIPGRGAFFFATEPANGFAKLGVIEANRMRFAVDNVDYECTSGAAIHGQGGEVWVRHDASYKPEGNWTHDREQLDRENFFVAAADSLGWWMR